MPATDKYVRNMKTMNWVFCLSVMALAAATLLMLYKDHDDEWREYQKQFFAYEADRTREQLDIAEGGDQRKSFEEQVANLETRIAEITESLDADADFTEKSEAVAAAALAFDLQGRKVRFIRADRDVARANYDIGVRDQVDPDSMAALLQTFDDLQSQVAEAETDWEVKEAELNRAQAALDAITGKRDQLADDLKKFTAEAERLKVSLDNISPEGTIKSAKRTLMEKPIIDGFNSHIRIVQDWLPDLHITLGMTSTARFDRCRTCHLGIDRFEAGNIPSFPHRSEADHSDAHTQHQEAGRKEADGAAKTYPHPYSSHPRPDVYLTASSPHPLPEFGCTICHDGAGSATSFLNAQHGPNDPIQEHHWKEKYGHFHNHFWEYQMLPERLREASCLKCHHEVIELGVNPKFGATAPKAFKGWQLIQKYGCFGCHEINGFDGKDRIGPDLRLEPTEEEAEKYANDPNLIPGKMRKVGPSLKHVAGKVSADWIAYWTEEPKRFRPTTKMPQFFGKELTNLHDNLGKKFSKVEISAIAQFLTKQSTPIKLLTPGLGEADRDADRGKAFFAQKGCLACHSHSAFKDSKADFGPNLSNVHEKISKDKGFNWLYTWIRDPERHHPRTKMPNLFLTPEFGPDGKTVVSDPAADIAEFLLSSTDTTIDKGEFTNSSKYEISDLEAIAKMYLAAVLTQDQIKGYFGSQGKAFPLTKKQIKGDEIELIAVEDPTLEQWREQLMNYVGRRSVTRYGCFGCHDINGFGSARPIGTTLQDWGRKDPSRLALEHIEEYLHHHGEPDGSSTAKLVEDALKTGAAGAFESKEQEEHLKRRAYFFDSLLHHGRPGFIFQKLRDPRSYDYEKISTKRYNERLVMPKFPLEDEEIEAIATFVLGLVAEPPAEKYVYTPTREDNDRNQGEILLRKFNCVGCHMLDMDKMEFTVPPYDPDEGNPLGRLIPNPLDPGESQESIDQLYAFRKPKPIYTGGVDQVHGVEYPIAQVRGLAVPTDFDPEDDPVDQIQPFTTWESYALNRPGSGGQGFLAAGSRVTVNGLHLRSLTPAQTGVYSKWLAGHLLDEGAVKSLANGYQAGPPVLLGEGDKVQTPWLYNFLKQPYKIRHTIVLRMPEFNMSDAEARVLANYFAAADGAKYPYQNASETQADYRDQANSSFKAQYPDRWSKHSYLDEGWSVLTGKSLTPGEQLGPVVDGKPAPPICSKCHQVGGDKYRSTSPDDFRGPNLDQVATRLRPDWVLNWINNPKRLIPTTSMPLNFANNKKNLTPLFHGVAADQVRGVRDALMNYPMILEDLAVRKSEAARTATAPAGAN